MAGNPLVFMKTPLEGVSISERLFCAARPRWRAAGNAAGQSIGSAFGYSFMICLWTKRHLQRQLCLHPLPVRREWHEVWLQASTMPGGPVMGLASCLRGWRLADGRVKFLLNWPVTTRVPTPIPFERHKACQSWTDGRRRSVSSPPD